MRIGELCGAAFVFFESRDTLIEGKRLLDLFEALNHTLEADAVHIFHCIQAFIHRFQSAADFAQLGRKESCNTWRTSSIAPMKESLL